jgi:dolichol-phosphate mannosyltransferase
LLANTFIQGLFLTSYIDMTTAFNLFRRGVIEGLRPIISHHFKLTVELPLKAMACGFTYEVVPNSRINRKAGESTPTIEEIGSRYLFCGLYRLIEKWLARGDHRRSKARPRKTAPMVRLSAPVR